MNKKSKWFLFIGIVIIIVISPTFLTLPALFKFWDFSQSGQIGDTIGGITAPIINLLGAILVYLSFNEQIKANNLQRGSLDNEIKKNIEQRNYNSIIHDIDNLRADINDFRIFDANASQGMNALYEFQKTIANAKTKEALEQIVTTQPFFNFYFLIASTDNIFTTIKKNDINDDDKRTLMKKLIYLYSSKIGPYAILILSRLNEFKVSNDLINLLTIAEMKLRVFMNDEKI
jgi:hypothetical protein